MSEEDYYDKPIFNRLQIAFKPSVKKEMKTAQNKKLYADVMDDIKVDMVKDDMRLKFLQL